MNDHNPQKQFAVLSERAPRERRVALIPQDVAKLAKKKLVILVEQGAGRNAGFTDDEYRQAGAEILDRASVLSRARVLVSVRPPDHRAIVPGSIIVSLGAYDDVVKADYAAHRLSHLTLEKVPRTTRAQGMDVLSSQAAIAGYAAAIEGAKSLDVLLPMMTTAAGGIKPAKMIALGAGVAGLQAIATARRLGAIVHGFDVRKAAGEQVESLGAKFVFPDMELQSDAAGGYAKAQSDDQQARLRRSLTPTLAEMRLVITSAQIPGKAAPLLIDDETFAAMTPGTVVIDLAAETGGNTSRTKPDEEVLVGGVRILGPTDLPSVYATDSSRLFSGNMRALLEHLTDADGVIQINFDDEITRALLGTPPVTAISA